jgi:hypothetical protein
VRSHLRGAGGIPLWTLASLPVVAALQVAIMTLIRPPARLLRSRRRTDPQAALVPVRDQASS